MVAKDALVTTTISPLYLYIDVFPNEAEIVFRVVYVIVAVLGLIGNVFVFYIFATKRVKLTPFNLLLLNLAISDAIACISIFPYIFIDLKQLRGRTKATADTFCVLVMGQSAYWMAIVASTFTLAVISISRYLFVRHPLKARLFNKKHASWIIIGAVWPVALAITIPNFFSLKFNARYAVCERIWPEGFNGKVFSSVTAVLGFVIPVVIMIFTFTATRRYFWRIDSRRISRSESAIRRRRKAALLLGALIIAFFLCWSPFFIYWILSRTVKVFDEGPKGDIQRMRVLRVVILISLCNTVADPIIYALRGDDFQKSVQKILDSFHFFARRQRLRTRTRSTECKDEHVVEHDVNNVQAV